MITLPSLTSLDQNASVRIWPATEPTDMRCGFDRLSTSASTRQLWANRLHQA